MLQANNIDEEKLKLLIEGCMRNSRKSQEAVYSLYYGKMMAVCRRYTNNDDEAKDMLQDGFIKLFKNIERFNFQGSFEGWVRRIVVNTAIDHVRKTKGDFVLLSGHQTIEDFEDNLQEEEDVELEELPDLNVGDVRNAMDKLSTAYKTVFNLYVFENYTHQQIAETLGINVGTSKSNLAKARANLKKILTAEQKQQHGE